MTDVVGGDMPSSGVINHNIKIASVTDNTSQHLIYTTEDKLELCINDYKKELDKQHSISTPFATTLTLWITVFTVDFKSVLDVPASTVQAIFWIAAILSAVWLTRSVIRWYRGAGTSSADFINHVKSRSSNSTTLG